jgi:hypothetical protein
VFRKSARQSYHRSLIKMDETFWSSALRGAIPATEHFPSVIPLILTWISGGRIHLPKRSRNSPLLKTEEATALRPRPAAELLFWHDMLRRRSQPPIAFPHRNLYSHIAVGQESNFPAFLRRAGRLEIGLSGSVRDLGWGSLSKRQVCEWIRQDISVFTGGGLLKRAWASFSGESGLGVFVMPSGTGAGLGAGDLIKGAAGSWLLGCSGLITGGGFCWAV